MTPDELDELMHDTAEMARAEHVDSPDLTAMGNAVQRMQSVEAAQVAALQAANVTDVDMAKWSRAQKQVPQKKRTRDPEVVRGWHAEALRKAADATKRAEVLQARLDARRARLDHGLLQVPLKARQQGAVTDSNIYREIVAAENRADHYRDVARKHAAWIERNDA